MDHSELLAMAPMWYVAFLLSLTCHEAAHALVALWGGDPTAFHGGQVTLNPVPHIRREPFGTVFFLSTNVLLWTIAGSFLLASVVVPRFYCRYACPLGASLAVASLISLKRIPRVEQCDHCKVCEKRCPTGAIEGPRIDFKECVRCNDCEVQLIRRTGVCRHDMEVIRPRLVQLQGRSAAGAAAAAGVAAPAD